MKTMLLLLALIIGPALSISQPGNLDETFANNGIFTYDFSNDSEDEIQDIGFLSDGSIVIVGYLYDNGSEYEGILLKLHPDGDVVFSKSFGLGSDFTNIFVQGVATKDDFIYITCNVYNENTNRLEILVIKYDANGEIVTSFGDNGMVSVGRAGGLYGFDITIDEMANLYIAGRSAKPLFTDQEAVAVKILSNGTVDLNYGDNGVFHQRLFGSQTGMVDGIVIDEDFYMVGWVSKETANVTFDQDAVVLKLDKDGSIDTDFGSNGSIVIDKGLSDYMNDICASGNNQILVVGEFGSSSDDVRVYRYDLNGMQDMSFGSQGFFEFDNGGDDDGEGVVVGGNNTIFVGASVNSEEDFALLALDSNGELINSFGSNGKRIVDIEGNDNLSDIGIDHEGNIFLGGESNEDDDPALALLKIEGYPLCMNIESNIELTACEEVIYQGNSYTSTGIYDVILQASNGCDSIVHANITINESTSASIQMNACDFYTLNNQTYNQSGTYTQMLQNSAGCDSVITLELIILSSSTSSIQDVSCVPLDINGETFNSSGTYMQIIPNAVGCDSVITIMLEILSPSASTLQEISCGPIDINGEIFSSSGTYAQVLMNAVGCDSILTLEIEIDTLTAIIELGSDNELICTNEDLSYQWIDCMTNEPISGATENTFVPESTGEFAVIVNSVACVDTSDCISVTISSTFDLAQNKKVRIFPNPTSEYLNIDLGVVSKNTMISLFNTIGEKIYYQSKERGGNLRKINMSEFDSGLYYVKVQFSDGSQVVKAITKI